MSSKPAAERRFASGDRLLHAIGGSPDGLTLPALVAQAKPAEPEEVLRWIGLARDRGVVDELPPADRETSRRFVLGSTGRRILEYDPRQTV
jgi:hypothetical protein